MFSRNPPDYRGDSGMRYQTLTTFRAILGTRIAVPSSLVILPVQATARDP